MRKLSVTLLALLVGLFISLIVMYAYGSNDTAGNPCLLDTTEDISLVAVAQRIEFIPDATDDDLSIEDAAGNVIWAVRGECSASNYEADCIEYIDFPQGIRVDGLYIKTIDGGKVRFYYIDGTRR